MVKAISAVDRVVTPASQQDTLSAQKTPSSLLSDASKRLEKALKYVSISSDAAKLKSCNHNRAEINSAIERYSVSNGSFPTNLSDLETLDYFPEGIPTCPLTGSAYALNSTINRVEGHTSSTSPGDH